MNDHEHPAPESETSVGDDSATQVNKEETEIAEKRAQAFDKLVDWFIEFDPYEIKAYVEDLRNRYPELSDDLLSQKIIDMKAIKNGLVGAATGIPGFLALPVTIPTDLLMTWKIQINLALCIATVYGQNIDEKDPEDLKTDIYMILAGKSAKDCLRILGIEVDAVTQKSVKRYVNRELIAEIWKQIAKQIAYSATRKGASRISKLVPFIGGPIGFAFDYRATKSVGSFARAYYRPGNIIDAEVN